MAGVGVAAGDPGGAADAVDRPAPGGVPVAEQAGPAERGVAGADDRGAVGGDGDPRPQSTPALMQYCGFGGGVQSRSRMSQRAEWESR